MFKCFSHHASFIVANHGVVASRQPLDLRHLKSHIQAVGQSIVAWGGRSNQGEEEGSFLHIHVTHVALVFVKKVWKSYRQTYRWEPPPLWRFPGGAASVWRCEIFSSPATNTETELFTHKPHLPDSWNRSCQSAILSINVQDSRDMNTYINEVFGVENLRDLIAEQILFSSPKTLDVNVLDDHLQSQTFLLTSKNPV